MRRLLMQLYDNAPVQEVSLEAIKKDLDLQIRQATREDVAEEYAEQLREQQEQERLDEVPPIRLVRDSHAHLLLADGWHRVRAAGLANLSTIRAKIIDGTKSEALMIAVLSNAKNPLKMSRQDKRRSVQLMLSDPEFRDMSDRQIANALGVTHPFVGRLRQEWFSADHLEDFESAQNEPPHAPGSFETTVNRRDDLIDYADTAVRVNEPDPEPQGASSPGHRSAPTPSRSDWASRATNRTPTPREIEVSIEGIEVVIRWRSEGTDTEWQERPIQEVDDLPVRVKRAIMSGMGLL